jgi:hypothetical protein
MDGQISLRWSRYPAGCEFEVERPPSTDASGFRTHGVRATLAGGCWSPDESDHREVVIRGRGEPEPYLLTAPSTAIGGPCWVSLCLADTSPNQAGVEEFVRRFGLLLPEMREGEFYAHCNFLQEVLFVLHSDGLPAVKERFPCVLKRGGRLLQPASLAEFVYRELDHLEGRIRLCSWEGCRRWYVPNKHAQQQRFCSRECKKKWEKAAGAKNSTPLLSVAVDCIQLGRLEDGRAILNKYIKENGGPDELEKSLAKVGMILPPGTLLDTLRRKKPSDLRDIAFGLWALRSKA